MALKDLIVLLLLRLVYLLAKWSGAEESKETLPSRSQDATGHLSTIL